MHGLPVCEECNKAPQLGILHFARVTQRRLSAQGHTRNQSWFHGRTEDCVMKRLPGNGVSSLSIPRGTSGSGPLSGAALGFDPGRFLVSRFEVRALAAEVINTPREATISTLILKAWDLGLLNWTFTAGHSFQGLLQKDRTRVSSRLRLLGARVSHGVTRGQQAGVPPAGSGGGLLPRELEPR